MTVTAVTAAGRLLERPLHLPPAPAPTGRERDHRGARVASYHDGQNVGNGLETPATDAEPEPAPWTLPSSAPHQRQLRHLQLILVPPHHATAAPPPHDDRHLLRLPLPGSADDVADTERALRRAGRHGNHSAGLGGGLTLTESSPSRVGQRRRRSTTRRPPRTPAASRSRPPPPTPIRHRERRLPDRLRSRRGDAEPARYSHELLLDATATASGAKTVTFTNGAAGTATGAFTVTSDTTGPAGQSAGLSGGPWYTTASIPLTLDNGTDAGSGVDTRPRCRRARTAHARDGTCDTFGGWAPITLSGGADTDVSGGNCYRYRYSVTDNVGNADRPRRPSADCKVDTSAARPSPPARRRRPPAARQRSTCRGTKTLYFRPDRHRLVHAQRDLHRRAVQCRPGRLPRRLRDERLDGSTGGADTSSPYASPADYSWTAGAARSAPRRDRDERAGLTADDSLTITADSGRPDRAIRLPRRRPLVRDRFRAAVARERHRRRGGRRLEHRRRRAAVGNPLGRLMRNLRRLVYRHAQRRRRRHRSGGNCYRYRYSISDLVGNASAPSASSRPRRSTPPRRRLDHRAVGHRRSGDQYYNAGSTTLFFRPSGSGSFTLNATASAPGSGVDHVAFPDLSRSTASAARAAAIRPLRTVEPYSGRPARTEARATRTSSSRQLRHRRDRDDQHHPRLDRPERPVGGDQRRPVVHERPPCRSRSTTGPTAAPAWTPLRRSSSGSRRPSRTTRATPSAAGRP